MNQNLSSASLKRVPRLCTLAILLAVAGGLPALGQPGLGFEPMLDLPRPEPPAMEPTGQVAALISELADEARQPAATQALLAMKPAIEPQLRGALQHLKPAATFPFLEPQAGYSNIFILDPDLLSSHCTQYALEVVRSHMEERQQLQGSVVTLHYRDAPLTNVLADFGRQIDAEVQAGNLFHGSLLGSRDWIKTNRVTIDFDRLNYWQAIQKLKQQAKLSEFHENLNRLLLIPQGFGFDAPMATSNERPVVNGPLQITPVSVELARRLEYGSGSNSARVTLTLVARAEPKFWNSGEHAMVQLDECVDDRGQSLLLAGATNFLSLGEGCYWSWKVPVEFRAPAPGRRNNTLKGHFNVALCMNQRYLTITNVMHAEGRSNEFDDIQLTVRAVRDGIDGFAGNFTEMIVERSAPAGSPLANQFTNLADIWNVSVFDESRKDIPILPRMDREDIWGEFRGEPRPVSPIQAVRGPGESRHEPGREVITLWLNFSKQVTPATLIWLTPSETRWLPVPFELHEVALPM